MQHNQIDMSNNKHDFADSNARERFYYGFSFCVIAL